MVHLLVAALLPVGAYPVLVHPVAASYPCRAVVRIPVAVPCHQAAGLVVCPYHAVVVHHMVDVFLLLLLVEVVENFQVRPVGAYLVVVAVAPVAVHLPGDCHPSYATRFVLSCQTFVFAWG